jgi:putative phosphoribosyl transferase
MSELFSDRRGAGRELGARLSRHAGRKDLVVLGVARGGVPVAYEVARALGAPLDVLVVRKLGVPGREELAIGALASGGARALNHDVLRRAGVGQREVDAITERERAELERREHAYRGEGDPIDVNGQAVVVVDDGLATGATMRAAIATLRQRGVEAIVVAVPVAAPATCAALREAADEIVCVRTPDPFVAVGLWYDDFTPVSDEQVRRLLDEDATGAVVPRG